MQHRYSTEANIIIKNLKEFNKEEFESWFEKQLIIGGSNIVEFLKYKKENGDTNGI